MLEGELIKKAIVTGANGFVGSWLVNQLSLQGVEVFAVVRSSRSDTCRIKDAKNAKLVVCSLADIALLPNLIMDRDIDALYHLAWDGGLVASSRSDYEVQIRNIKYSLKCVEVAKQMGCKRFVGCGSIMEHEALAYVALEGSTPWLNYMYSTAKLSTHYMTKILALSLGIEHVWGIISNAYGENEKSQRFFNTTINKMIKDENVQCTAAQQLYDFVHVYDVARAFVLLGQKGHNLKAYYIGSGQPLKLKEFIHKIKAICASKSDVEFGAVPFNGASLEEDVFSIEALKKDLGFIPKITFEEGVRLVANEINKATSKDCTLK